MLITSYNQGKLYENALQCGKCILNRMWQRGCTWQHSDTSVSRSSPSKCPNSFQSRRRPRATPLWWTRACSPAAKPSSSGRWWAKIFLAVEARSEAAAVSAKMIVWPRSIFEVRFLSVCHLAVSAWGPLALQGFFSVGDVAVEVLADVQRSRRTQVPPCRTGGSRGRGGSRTAVGSQICHFRFRFFSWPEVCDDDDGSNSYFRSALPPSVKRHFF